MRLTQKQLDCWLAKWKVILRLQDWEIDASLYHRDHIEGADGKCDHEYSRKQAAVYIATRRGRPDTVKPHDPELTLVHELIHLHFAPFQAKDMQSLAGKAQEQAIECLTTSLIALDRGTSPT